MRRQVSGVTVRRFDAHLYMSQQLIVCGFEIFRGFRCRTDAGEREMVEGELSPHVPSGAVIREQGHTLYKLFRDCRRHCASPRVQFLD